MEPSTSDLENDPPSEEPLQNVAESSDLKNSRSDENQTLDHEKATTANSEMIEIPESTVITSKESESEINIEDGRVKNFENYKKTRNSIRKLSQNTRRPPVILTFKSQERQKQHVFGNIQSSFQNRQNQNIPSPPSYSPRFATNQRNINARQNQDINFSRFHTPQPTDFNFGHIIMNPTYWCPYPSSVPPRTPACLAHLVDVDSLFVIKSFEILEYVANFSEPDHYLIQNKNGLCLYYASETYNYLPKCCPSQRGTQLILKDFHHNDVIFLNKYCGCNSPCFFCCYPVMEVYAPPSVPVGAIYRVCESSQDDYIILDADENAIFKIRGSLGGNFFASCAELNYTIYSMDNNKTIMGYIKRQNGDFITHAFNPKISGISFPSNLDVRIKSIFLGALMLMQITYFT